MDPNRMLRTYHPTCLFLVLTLGATLPSLAQTPEPMEVRRAEAVFEELPELKASEILKPELLKGPHFVVRDPVPTGSGMNQFTIDSDFGVFEADGNRMKDAIGYSDKKRKIALQMGIDPYSTNTVLQKELDDVAWASWAGGFAFSAATFPISGPIGAALTVTNLNSTVEELLREKSPSELEQINRSTFRAMGEGASDTERILHGGAFTPTQATTFAVHLKALNGVANRGAFVKVAAQKSTTEADALFCVYTAALMNQIHQKTPIARIVMLRDFPICVAKDGTIIVALQWDYAAWTSGAASFTDEVQKLAGKSGQSAHVSVGLSGEVSPRLREELEKRGMTVQDRLVPGPLK